MPYALIPEGFELKKVTKLQEEAVKAHRRHEDMVALLGNEKVPLLVAGGVVLVSAPTILRIIFDALAKQKPEFDGVDIIESGVDYLTFTKDFAEALFDVTGAGKFGPGEGFFGGEAEDFWEKYVKK